MSTFVVPPLDDADQWPTLGPLVAAHMEQTLAYGPGDLLGQPYQVDDEFAAILDAAYRVYPKDHPRAGRRAFDTVVLMLPKGTAKSERMAAIGAMELDPDAPVRCDGWRKVGRLWEPVGRPVTDPYCYILAFAKEQAEDTSFEAMRQMILLGPGADRFDVWEERIVRRGGHGQAEALASAPDSRDGGKTTWQGKEESHRWVLPRQKEAHQTTRGNLSKRPMAQPWEMHATTMYQPGEASVAEDLHETAKSLTGDAARRSRMFFFYRWADKRIRIRREDGAWDVPALREAITDARGPVCAEWSDVDGIVELQFTGAGADPDYGERVWLNRPLRKALLAFDADRWKALARTQHDCSHDKVTLGFDGAKVDDHCALIATCVRCGHQWPLGIWDPHDYESVDLLIGAVDAAVDDAFRDLTVVLMYADPPYWKDELAGWSARHGDKVVLKWETWRNRPMGFACRSFAQAITDGRVSHPGDATFTAHIGRCYRKGLTDRDDKGEHLWTVQKEREHSPLKIDAAVAAVLSWEARAAAISAGALTAGAVRHVTASDLDDYYGPTEDAHAHEAVVPPDGTPEPVGAH